MPLHYENTHICMVRSINIDILFKAGKTCDSVIIEQFHIEGITMPKWTEYRQTAQSRGALAFELFIVESTLVKSPESAQAILPQHLEYQKDMEMAGKLVLAGPLSDLSGEEMSGCGMIVYRAETMSEAMELALNDPMHQSETRTFTLRRWLVNEGSLSISVKLAHQSVSLS